MDQTYTPEASSKNKDPKPKKTDATVPVTSSFARLRYFLGAVAS